MGYCIYLRKGETHTAPSSGILASDLAVGDIVKLTESGTSVEYIVVNQGIPTGGESLYDSSCDGTWLLRKDCYSAMQYNSDYVINYASSNINTWLNGDFFNNLGVTEQSVIKQAVIPYCPTMSTVSSGTSGLSTKCFILSQVEIGWGGYTYTNDDGAKLDYFIAGATSDAYSKRVAYQNDTASTVMYWTRSPHKNKNNQVWIVDGTGNRGNTYPNQTTFYVRPALVLPSTAKFDKDTKILKG